MHLATDVSDERILALVAAAEALRRRRLDGHPGTPQADERMLHLDWAVRAGRSVLAARAATPSGPLAAQPAPRHRR